MSKKILMNIMLCITVILFLSQGIYKFFLYNEKQIYKGKECIILHQPEAMNRKEYIYTLIKISNELSSDLLYERIDENMNKIFYKTNHDNDFLDIYTENHTILLQEGEVLSTNKELGTQKIYGLHFPGEDIVIKDISKLIDIDLTNGRFWVIENEKDNFINQFNTYDIECENVGKVMVDEEDEPIQPLINSFLFFLAISIVFHLFSKAKDFAIKKSMGYSNFTIFISEIRDNLCVFSLEIIVICLMIVVILTFLFDFISTLYFLKEIIVTLLQMLAIVFLIYLLATSYVCVKCTVMDIKGKRKNRTFSVVLTLFKTITFVIMIIMLSEILIYVRQVYDVYQMTLETREKLENYATTTINTSIENPEDDLEKYDIPFCEMYRILHEKNGAIVADASSAKWSESDLEMGAVPIDINDNYLDFNERIFDLQGKRITSDCLKENKLNILIPLGYDSTIEVEGLCRAHRITKDQIHLIEYSKDSEFFSFDNENHPKTGGYFKNPIAVVFDEDMINDPVYRAVCIESFCVNGFYFKVEKQAYEEIYPVLKQCGLTNIICSTPSISDRFNENLNVYWQELIINIFKMSLYLFAFMTMLICSAEMYFINNKKQIIIKLASGYSLLEILKIPLLGQISIIVLLLVIRFFYTVSIPIMGIAIGVELVLYYFIIKKQCCNNLVEVIKGEF